MEETTLKSILVVDDIQENIDVLRGILGECYTVKVATSGRLALKIAFSAKPPDLILLDVMMPEMDGYEVCRQLKEDERTRNIPVIFVTAKSEVEEEAHGFSLGAADYIVKPVSAPVVLARVRTHLELYDRSRHLERLVQERTTKLETKNYELKIALDRANEAERKIISISEETQQRIGQELHDDLGQLLTGVAFMSEVLYKKLEKQGRAEIQEASKITALINEAVSKTRMLAQGLYPVELKEAGLPAMLERLAHKTQDIYKIECVFSGDMKFEIDDDLVAINLYRIAQEAVNNAIKYSGAKRITVELKSTPSVTILEIADNGCGISNPTGSDVKDGLGMHSMQYRATLLGGALRIGVPPGGGTSIAVNLPVKD